MAGGSRGGSGGDLAAGLEQGELFRRRLEGGHGGGRVGLGCCGESGHVEAVAVRRGAGVALRVGVDGQTAPERALEVQEIRTGSFAVIDPAPKGF